MFITPSIVLCLSLVSTEVKVGDRVVTLSAALVMNGSETVAEIEPGVELAVTGLRPPWVGVRLTRDGKEIVGWILDRSLVGEPWKAFAKLLSHDTSVVERSEREFERMDANGDGMLTVNEWTVATKLETVGELNNRLMQVLGPGGLGSGIAAGVKHMQIMAELAKFPGWKRPLDAEQFTAMADDFVRTRDIRRSRLAQQLLEPDDSKVRARRAEVLFRWADSDRDGHLSLDEFKQALPQAD
jgi:Ca2+-binding EF-hand superfamily protein